MRFFASIVSLIPFDTLSRYIPKVIPGPIAIFAYFDAQSSSGRNPTYWWVFGRIQNDSLDVSLDPYTRSPMFSDLTSGHIVLSDLSSPRPSTRWLSDTDYIGVKPYLTRQKASYNASIIPRITRTVNVKQDTPHKEEWRVGSAYRAHLARHR